MGSLTHPMPPPLTISLCYILGTTDPFTLVLQLRYPNTVSCIHGVVLDIVWHFNSDLRAKLFQAIIDHLAYVTVLEFVSHRLGGAIDFTRNLPPRTFHSLAIISSQLTSPPSRDFLSSLLAIWATKLNPLTCELFSNLPYRSMRRRRVSHWHNTRSPSNSRIVTPSKPLLAFSAIKHDLLWICKEVIKS